MIINILNNNKILKEKFDLLLPDFTVLTGENGSGKTQLLHSLKQRCGIWDMEYAELYPDNDYMNLYHVPNIDGTERKNPNSLISNDNINLTNVVYSAPGIQEKINPHIPRKNIFNEIKNKWNKLKPIVLAYNLIKSKNFENIDLELNALNIEVRSIVNQYVTGNKGSIANINKSNLLELKEISKKSNKKISDLEFTDYIVFYKIPTETFNSAINLLFHQYYLKEIYYPHLTINIKNPLDVFNNILKKAKFKYSVKYNPLTNEETPNKVTFIDNENSIDKVQIETLSSGEKTIMSLIFVLYHSSNNGSFPDVILFDEPDAHLHPSLTKVFLDVIENVLVKEQNVKVIMTTHSPSTIALSPSKSVYKMDRKLGYPIKENQKNAIERLSNGLASISIDEGSLGIRYGLKSLDKDVLFTEGITDKIILEIAWEKLYGTKEMPFFIQDCYSADFLRILFTTGDQQPDGIFIQFPQKKMVALFDFDNAGYNNWNKGKKFNLIENNPRKGLLRKNEGNGYLMLLPVPDDENIKKLVIIENNDTYKDKSNLTIESLFLHIQKCKENFFKEEPVIGGSIPKVNNNKREFTEYIKNLKQEDFKNCEPIFDAMNKIIYLK